MVEALPTPNFKDIDGFTTYVYDAEAVPRDLWEKAQLLQRESYRALLTSEDQSQADELVKLNDIDAYVASRVNPNILVGNGWGDNQLFRSPRFAATFDRSSQLVGVVLTADNTSSSLPLPKPLKSAEYWAKMLIKPGLPVPILGNKRYDHLREVYTHPDLQEKTNEDDQAFVASSVALLGIYHSLRDVEPEQMLSAYILPADPVDTELTCVTETIGMSETGYRMPNTLPGYSAEDKLVRVQAQVARVMNRIIEMPGAMEAFNSIRASKVSDGGWYSAL
jgi:hypothetical protein